jgi:site-specific DNA recombinase
MARKEQRLTLESAKRMKIRKDSGEKIAVIYLRKSKDHQRDSIERQRDECLMYAADHGYKIVGEYTDAGISGASSAGYCGDTRRKSKKERAGFLQLVADAQAGKFDFVICWKQNRASRSKPREVVAEFNPIQDAGVKLVFTNKGVIDLDNFSDLIQVTCDANTAYDFLNDGMPSDVISGQRRKALMGLWVSGTIGFGFATTHLTDAQGNVMRGGRKNQPITGMIILGDPEDVKTVRLMFEWYIEGYSQSGIIQKL